MTLAHPLIFFRAEEDETISPILLDDKRLVESFVAQKREIRHKLFHGHAHRVTNSSKYVKVKGNWRFNSLGGRRPVAARSGGAALLF
jgi:hypothetical protein